MSQMIEVKTAELEGAALDWAVVEAIGAVRKPGHVIEFPDKCPFPWIMGLFRPSIEWHDGGPLIDRHMVAIDFRRPLRGGEIPMWYAQTWQPYGYGEGPAPLIAACRAIVAAKLGDTVAVPAELLP